MSVKRRCSWVFLGFFFYLCYIQMSMIVLSFPCPFFLVYVCLLCVLLFVCPPLPFLPPFFLFCCGVGVCVVVVVGGTKFKLMGLWYRMVWFMQTMADYDIYFFI